MKNLLNACGNFLLILAIILIFVKFDEQDREIPLSKINFKDSLVVRTISGMEITDGCTRGYILRRKKAVIVTGWRNAYYYRFYFVDPEKNL